MFRFNLLLFIRQLWYYKRFSIASFAGLVVGITAFLIVLLFSNAIDQYNNWDPAFNNIFELRYNKPFKALGDGKIMRYQAPMLSRFLSVDRGIVSFCKVKEQPQTLIQTSRNMAFETDILAVDSAFFRVFPFRLRYGNPLTALDFKHNIILSGRMALKYFGKLDCVGDSLQYGNEVMKVSGVFSENGPVTFPIDFVLPLTIPKWAMEKGWGNFGYKYYCALPVATADSPALRDSLSLHISQRWYQTSQVFESQASFVGLGKSFDEWDRNPNKVRMIFFPVKHLYLEDKKSLFGILLAIGTTILILCCLDYTNKQISFSDTRNIEIGIKSLNGWTPLNIAIQVLWETVLFVLAAFFCAYILVELLLPFINQLLKVDMQFYPSLATFSFQWKFIVFFVLVVVSSGAYPAFYMASFEPISVLKGDYQGQDRGHRFKLGLLSFQMILGMTILIVLGSILSQINYLKNKNIGYDYHQLYYTRISSAIAQHEKEISQLDSLMSTIPSINGHAFTSIMPMVEGSYNFEIIKASKGTFNCLSIDIDDSFLNVLHTSALKDGRLPHISGNEILVNEMFVKTLNLKEPIVGQKVFSDVPPSFGIRDTSTYIIKGVVKNILYQSWEFKEYPVFYTNQKKRDELFMVFRARDNADMTFAKKLETQLLQHFPNDPFQVLSSEANYKESFKTLQFLSSVLGFFTLLIFMGVILGFVTYVHFYFQKRKKEVVLRILMGAQEKDFFQSFSRQFVVYFIVSVLLSWGISFCILRIFFTQFAYIMPYPYWLYIGVPFFYAFLLVLIIFLAIRKILKEKPGEVLRYE